MRINLLWALCALLFTASTGCSAADQPKQPDQSRIEDLERTIKALGDETDPIKDELLKTELQEELCRGVHVSPLFKIMRESDRGEELSAIGAGDGTFLAAFVTLDYPFTPATATGLIRRCGPYDASDAFDLRDYLAAMSGRRIGRPVIAAGSVRASFGLSGSSMLPMVLDGPAGPVPMEIDSLEPPPQGTRYLVRVHKTF
jgi:hypothetical protein